MRRFTLVTGALVVAVALAGCGGSSSSKSKSTGSTGSGSSSSSMAQVCGAHAQDVGTIAGALFAFQQYMEAGDPSSASALSTSQGDLDGAVSDLQDATAAAHLNSPAIEHFFQLLTNLRDSVDTPPTVPTKFAGDQDVALIHQAANAAGCNIGG